MVESRHDLGDDAGGGRRCVIGRGAWTDGGDVFRVRGGGEEAAVRVGEPAHGGFCKCFSLVEAGLIAGGFEEGQGSACHAGLVVQQAGRGGGAFAPGVVQPAVGGA